jgi:NAD(P)-dependent dehydrogenase (short-subunit alcohol dehydrogenase family)
MFNLLRQRVVGHKAGTASFKDQTILVTAATGGIGLEAAKKLAVRGTSKLIITGRDEKKAATAKAAIETHLKSLSPNPNPSISITALALEMAQTASIHSFIDSLKAQTKHLDQAILNAGFIATKYDVSADGYESVIQVNTVSTAYLSLQLLPFLLASPRTKQAKVADRPHLSLISSGTAWGTTLESIRDHSKSDKPMAELSSEKAWPQGTMGGGVEYGRSKLLLEFIYRRLAFLPSLSDDSSDPKSNPKVMVVSTCPGMTQSDLGRGFTEEFNVLMNAAVKVAMFAISKSTENGAEIYMTSLEQGIEARGQQWKDDRLWTKGVRERMESDEGKKLGDKVWDEMKEYAIKQDTKGVVREMLA